MLCDVVWCGVCSGHGTLLTLFAMYLIWKEEELEKKVARKEMGEIFPMAFGGRYLLVGMGICAVYCGIMYNDCFSVRTCPALPCPALCFCCVSCLVWF